MINFNKIILWQIQVEPWRPDLNIQSILNFLENVERQSLVLFPELCISWNFVWDLFFNESFIRECKAQNNKILKISKEKNFTIVWGNIDFDEKKKNEDWTLRKYNAIYIASDWKIIKTHHKILFSNFQNSDENRYFTSLERLAFESWKNLEEFLKPTILGFDWRKIKISLHFWNELFIADKNYFFDSIKSAKKNKIDLMLFLWTFPFTINKTQKLDYILKNQSKKSTLILVNPIWTQNNWKNIYTFDWFSAIYQNWNFIKWIENFCEKKEIKKIKFKDEIEQIYETLIFSIKNFFTQIWNNKLIIWLSWGIDSWVSATLLKIALWKENIIWVNMPSKFNSETTKNLAMKLAKNLQIKYIIFPIDKAINQSINDLQTITWKQVTDFQIENIQARQRWKIMAELSATYNSLYVSNANKDELLTWYFTLYWDSTWSVAILWDLTKIQVVKLARFINKKFKKEIIPQKMIELKPTAELSEKQNPENWLWDPFNYEFLSKLNEAIILKNKSKDELFELLEKNKLDEFLWFKNWELKSFFSKKEDLLIEIEKIYLLKKKSIFKRIQTPPIFSITWKSFWNDYRESQISVKKKG